MRDTILIVDDIDINRDMLEGILCEEYHILTASNGIEAMRIIKQECTRLSAVLLDLVMPEMDGYEVLKSMSSLGYLSQIPVLVISTEDSLYSEKQCFNAGVSDFIHKPFDKDLVRTRVDNIVNLYQYKQHLEEKVNEQTRIIRRRNSNILELLGSITETRNLESGEHVKRVKEYTRIIGELMMFKYPKYNLTPEILAVIIGASALHDVGKIGIPDSILLKPGKLTDEEYEIMKTHTTIGCEFFNNAGGMWDDEYAHMSYDICRHHHERCDGRGYPDHLKGDDIPIAAQLVSLADVYDALVHKRCYKDAYSKTEAFDMIMRGECGQFSPELLDCFQCGISEMEKVGEVRSKSIVS